MTTRLLTLPLALCVLALAPAIAEAESRVVGDFNGDGDDDLAVGKPLEGVTSASDAGAVNVIYGSGSRLTANADQLWDQNSTGIAGAAEERDRFGSSLAAGDFNGDGHDDLAVGVPGEVVVSFTDDGAVNVIYGSASGLTPDGSQFWHQDSPGIADTAEQNDKFGFSLAAGDFNGSGHDDLAIGVPGEGVAPSSWDDGAVNVIYGSGAGLAATGDHRWHQDSPGIDGVAQDLDRFGFSLAAGDFNGDGDGDLAVGVPLDGNSFGGAVNVIYGSANRLTATGSQLWDQNSTGIADVGEEDDRFGFSLAAGDFNGSGHDDLAVGVELEDVGSVSDAGAVNAIYGAGVGLRANGNQLWDQESTGIADAAEIGDRFGSSLTAGDVNGDGPDDLAVGVPVEDVGSVSDAGAVNAIYGSGSRLTANGNQLWDQESTGIADAAETGDRFGSSLTAGDFNGSGHDDLAVGVPQEDVGSVSDAGAVNAIYGAGVGLRANGNQLWHQESTGIEGVAEADDEFGTSLPT